MKFYEAAPKMQPGDVFEPDDEDYKGFLLCNDGIFRSADDEKTEPRLVQEFFKLNGQIIPAQPKVLTVDELIHAELVKRSAVFYEGDWAHVCVISAFKRLICQSHQNGRLERDIELKNMQKAVKTNSR